MISLVPAERVDTTGPEWKFGRDRVWRRGGQAVNPQAFARAQVCDPHAEQVVREQTWRLSVPPPGITGTTRVFLERDLSA